MRIRLRPRSLHRPGARAPAPSRGWRRFLDVAASPNCLGRADLPSQLDYSRRAGRPRSKGNGQPLSDPTSPLTGPGAQNRVSGYWSRCPGDSNRACPRRTMLFRVGCARHSRWSMAGERCNSASAHQQYVTVRSRPCSLSPASESHSFIESKK